MKKIITLVSIFSVLFSCSKKEEENQNVKELELKVKELELQKQQAVLAEKNRRLKAGAQKLENDKKRLDEEKRVQQSTTSSFNTNNIESYRNYTVIANDQNPAYFYNSPNYSDRRNARFTTVERIYVQEVQDDFAYVEFTNSDNKTSKGWIETAYLR